MPQQNQAAGKLKHSEKVFSVTLIPHDQASKILQPGKESFDFPAPAVSPQTTFVLCLDSSVAAVRGNYFNSVMSELGVKLV
jgi:hypothetical protein